MELWTATSEQSKIIKQFSTSAWSNLTILVPGLPQLSWNQRDRAWILFGSYSLSLIFGVFAWGTPASLAILIFSFATHIFSAADAIGQHAFPPFGRVVPTLTTSAFLGIFYYGPALVMASGFAWPVFLAERPREGYLVNRWAYHGDSPSPGETIWLRPTRMPRPRLARVVAGPGQRIEWSGFHFQVNGATPEATPFCIAGSPLGLNMLIPQGHLMIVFGTEPYLGGDIERAWEIVNQSDVQGRAWARSYPILDRLLLL